MGIAMVYLLVLAAGFTGALLALVWLFGGAPGEGTGAEREAVEGSRSADRAGAGSTPAASVEPERSEGKAA